MVAISAIRETEAWSGTSIGAGLVLAVVVVGLIVFWIRRFLQGP
jgi:hypothetical protein